MNSRPNIDAANLVERRIGDELLLYNLLTNKAFYLNRISTDIYDFCDGTNEIFEIADKTKLPENLVKLAIVELNKQNLLKEQIKIQTSRRDLLRSLALTSIALPIVMTLIAPNAARAASTCGTVPPGVSFTIPNNGGTSSCFTAANDAVCQSCRVNAAACANPTCTVIACTCR